MQTQIKKELVIRTHNQTTLHKSVVEAQKKSLWEKTVNRNKKFKKEKQGLCTSTCTWQTRHHVHTRTMGDVAITHKGLSE